MPLSNFKCAEKGALFRNEFREQIGFAGGHQFLDLLFWNFPLQNHFTDAERARFFDRDRILAGVGIIERVTLAILANGTGAQDFVPRRIDGHGARRVAVFEIKLRFELSIRARACVRRLFGLRDEVARIFSPRN